MQASYRTQADSTQPSRGRHRGQSPERPGSARSPARESLDRNSAFLIANLVLSAACGYGALSLMTRLYSVDSVGLSATAVSASGLIVFIMQFGANYSLPRYLPTSSHRTELINTALTLTISASLLGTVAFLILPVPFVGKLYALGGGLFVLLFLLATCVQAGGTQLSTVLIADRSSSKVASGNFLPNLIKVAAPPAFMTLGGLGAYLARTVYGFVSFVFFGVVLARKGHRFRPALSRAATRELRSFSFGMYIASLIGSAPLMLLPIIVLARFGPSQAAYWSVAFAIASLLFQLPSTVGQALLPEVALRHTERRYLVRRSAFLVAMIVVPVLVIGYLAAPLGLTILGKHYVTQALGSLRWLIIACLITVMNYATGTVLFLAKKTLVISIVNVIDAVIVLGLAVVWATGAEDVAISWVIGDVGNTVLFALFAFIALREVGGRWEDLGKAKTGDEAVRSAFSAPTRASQLQALDVLLSLSRPVPVPEQEPEQR